MANKTPCDGMKMNASLTSLEGRQVRATQRDNILVNDAVREGSLSPEQARSAVRRIRARTRGITVTTIMKILGFLVIVGGVAVRFFGREAIPLDMLKARKKYKKVFEPSSTFNHSPNEISDDDVDAHELADLLQLQS